jgi:hypothetical protein
MESFFTGNDYYCEEKYEPIANNTNLKHKTVYKSLISDDKPSVVDRERIKALNKVLDMSNKNVQQPDTGEPLIFTHEGRIVTIFGQVLNDFSLLEYRSMGLCSIAVYKELIIQLVSKGFNVVFKAHPWEEKKTNISRPLTRDAIRDYAATLTEALQQRIQVVDHYPIDKLFNISYAVVGLNSQSLIEAAFHGFKPIQFADAFFGQKGFTHDFSLGQVGEVITRLQQGSLAGTLTLDEYRRFEDFLVIALQRYLVSCYPSGLARLREVFKMPELISIISKKDTEAKNKTSITPAKPPTELAKAGIAITALSAKPEGVQAPTLVETGQSYFERKLLKLRRNPRKFFSDSKYLLVRSFRHIF